MDDVKRDGKTKRSKGDVKNVYSNYLQKRNYSDLRLMNISKSDYIQNSLVETEIARSNSILYSCYTIDPIVIDHNFSKFLLWLKDLLKNNNTVAADIEYLVGPLFCHLYLDILHGGNAERAESFLKCHLPTVEKTKCNEFVRDLISAFGSSTNSETNVLQEQFRSHKYEVSLNWKSIELLKTFVLENCHIVFLEVLHTWFHLRGHSDLETTSTEDCDNENNCEITSTTFSVEDELKLNINMIFQVNISNCKQDISCGLISRRLSVIILAESNQISLSPIHKYNSILDNNDCEKIKFRGHSGRIFNLTVSLVNNLLGSGSSDGTICVYDLEKINLVHVCVGHSGSIYCLSFSSNGQYIASGSEDKTARLWNTTNGQLLRIFAGHSKAIMCLDFHTNCLYICTGSADRLIRLWSIDNGEPLRLFHGCKGIVYSVKFSPCGQFMMSSSEDKKLRKWDILSSKILAEISVGDLPLMRLLWSKDGKELCGATNTGVVKIFDSSLGKNGVDSSSQDKQINTHTENLGARLLCLDYAFGSFTALTVS